MSGLDGGFVKLFQRNLQKLLFTEVWPPLKNLVLYSINFLFSTFVVHVP